VYPPCANECHAIGGEPGTRKVRATDPFCAGRNSDGDHQYESGSRGSPCASGYVCLLIGVGHALITPVTYTEVPARRRAGRVAPPDRRGSGTKG
jgi:hypothetical protein